jgi:hypothetical protein
MANVLIGAPIFSDVGVLLTPTLSGGSWEAGNPLTNLQDRRLWKVARSSDDAETSTRVQVDLGADRAVRVVCIPKHTVSSAGQWRVVGRPSTLLFGYVAGEDIAARGGVYARVPAADARTGSYVDRAGVLRYAAENRLTYSAAFDNAAWVKSNVSVVADAVAGPDGTTAADTLTASAGNGTVIQDAGVLASAAFTFSVWLKRKTGTGTVQLTLDNGSNWTTVSVTDDWVRHSLTATVANPDCGIRLVTNADAVWAWGAQLNLGSVADAHVATTAATNTAPRDGHWIGGARTLLCEVAGTNLCLRSQEFDNASWSKSNCSATANSATAPDGTLTADTLTSSTTAGQAAQTVTFTADGEKCFAVFLKAGTSTRSQVYIRDSTAGVTRHAVNVTWTAGVPSLATNSGSGTLFPVEALGNGWYRILISATGVVAANSNAVAILPDTLVGTNAVYAWGAQAENATVPSSYTPTTTATVTRATDSLYFPFTAAPQEMTVYVRGVNVGVYTPDGSNYRVLQIGAANLATDARLAMGKNTANQHFAQYDDGSTEVTSQGAFGATVTHGDTIEHRAVLSATWTVRSHGTIDDGSEASASASGASGSAASWAAGNNRLYLTGGLSSNNGSFAYTHVAISAGTKTLDECRDLLYDSGWLDAWPSGWDAETAENLNLPLLHILDEDFDARYWSVQVSDTANPDGVVDLARLCITGAYEPSVNFVGGASVHFESDSTVRYADGGNAIHDTRPLRRVSRFTIAHLEDAEAWGSAWRTMRKLGPAGQCVLVLAPDTTADLMPESAFLAVPRELTRLEYPFALFRSAAFAFAEEL